MKYIEYAIYDLDISEIEAKSNIELAIKYGATSLSVPFALTKLCRSLTKGTGITTSNAIDYPLGIMDTKTRNIAITNAIENGAEKIDIVLQNNYLNYKKYDKIRYDITSNLEICKKFNVDLIYYLEYRVFTHQALIKACNILLEFDIKYVYVSTGNMIDNTEDNVIASVLLHQKTGINTIFTGNAWTTQHFKLISKNNISSVRFTNINSLIAYKHYRNKEVSS